MIEELPEDAYLYYRMEDGLQFFFRSSIVFYVRYRIDPAVINSYEEIDVMDEYGYMAVDTYRGTRKYFTAMNYGNIYCYIRGLDIEPFLSMKPEDYILITSKYDDDATSFKIIKA